MRKETVIRSIGCGVLAVAATCLIWTWPAGAITPHEAQYELYLDDHALGEEVRSSGGQMEIRYELGCDGWTTLFSFEFTMTLGDGAPINLGYMSRTEEALDGGTFRFEHMQLAGGEVVEAFAGTAHSGEGAPPEAVFTFPEKKRLSLPKGTMFPLAAWRDLLTHVGEEPSAASYTLFDGWDAEGPGTLRVWATRAKLDPAAQTDGKQQDGLLDGPSWHVNSAYFPIGSSAMEPVSSTVERLYESGVSDPIRFNWRELTVRAKAVSVKPLATPKC